MNGYSHPVNPATLGSRFGDPKRKAFHFGDDYRVGVGTPVRSIGDGVVESTPQHRLYGFYTTVRHPNGDLSTLNQLQRGHRPAPGTRVQAGTVLGYVGHPRNDLTEAQRNADPTWAGCAKVDAFGNRISSGPHVHAGVQRRGAWINPATVITRGVAAIPASQLPTLALLPEEEADMIPIRLDGKHIFTLARGQIAHQANQPMSTFVRNVHAAADVFVEVDQGHMRALLDSVGVPQGVVNYGNGHVLNPESGKYEAGGMWNWERQLRKDTETAMNRNVAETSAAFHQTQATLAANQAATLTAVKGIVGGDVDLAAITAATEAGYAAALSKLTLVAKS